MYSRPSGRSNRVNSSFSPALSYTSPSPTLWTRFTTPRNSVPSGSTLAPPAHNGVATAAATSIPGLARYVEMGVNRRASIAVPCGGSAAATLPERHAQARAITLRRVRRAGKLAWFMRIGLACEPVQFFDFFRKSRYCTLGQNSDIRLPSNIPRQARSDPARHDSPRAAGRNSIYIGSPDSYGHSENI